MRRAAVAAAALVLLAGCQADDGDSDAGQEAPVDLGSPPELAQHEGPAPQELVVDDLEEGDGQAAATGDELSVHLVVRGWGAATPALSTWERGQPRTVALGEGEVVDGLEQGLSGMRVGGRRRLLVPAELAYGDRGAPGIEAGQAVEITVDLLEVR